MNLAPKKPNWDLKRDVDKKLAKLEKRTKKAIIEILSRSFATASPVLPGLTFPPPTLQKKSFKTQMLRQFRQQSSTRKTRDDVVCVCFFVFVLA